MNHDIETIFCLVREAIPSLQAGRTPQRDDDLQTVGLTSLAAVKLMMSLEARFGVAIPDDDLKPENFRTIAAIDALVTRLKAA